MVEVLQRYANTVQHRKPPKLVGTECRQPAQSEQPTVPQHTHKAAQRLDPATLEQLVTDYRDGMPTAQLISRYHLSKGAILRIMDAHQVPRRNTAMSSDDAVTAIQLYQQGWSLAQVGKHLNRDAGTYGGGCVMTDDLPSRTAHSRCGTIGDSSSGFGQWPAACLKSVPGELNASAGTLWQTRTRHQCLPCGTPDAGSSGR